MLLAIMNGVIRINQNSFEISKTFIAILFLSISLISMKEVLKKVNDIKDDCDCSVICLSILIVIQIIKHVQKINLLMNYYMVQNQV